MRYADIQSALIKAWNDGNFGLTTLLPDRNEAPTTDHARLSFIPADNTPATMGDDGTNEVAGIFQADIMMRTGRGNGEILDVVDTVCAAFPSGRRVSYNGQQVIIWGAALNGPKSEGGWLRATVSINFAAYVRRST